MKYLLLTQSLPKRIFHKRLMLFFCMIQLFGVHPLVGGKNWKCFKLIFSSVISAAGLARTLLHALMKLNLLSICYQLVKKVLFLWQTIVIRKIDLHKILADLSKQCKSEVLTRMASVIQMEQISIACQLFCRSTKCANQPLKTGLVKLHRSSVLC